MALMEDWIVMFHLHVVTLRRATLATVMRSSAVERVSRVCRVAFVDWERDVVPLCTIA